MHKNIVHHSQNNSFGFNCKQTKNKVLYLLLYVEYICQLKTTEHLQRRRIEKICIRLRRKLRIVIVFLLRFLIARSETKMVKRPHLDGHEIEKFTSR